MVFGGLRHVSPLVQLVRLPRNVREAVPDRDSVGGLFNSDKTNLTGTSLGMGLMILCAMGVSWGHGILITIGSRHTDCVMDVCVSAPD